MEGNSKDNKFKIHLSTEDINKIDEEIRVVSEGSQPIEKSNEVKNTVKGLRLVNVCTNCENEFIPNNSMINEKLCKTCLEKQYNKNEND